MPLVVLWAISQLIHASVNWMYPWGVGLALEHHLPSIATCPVHVVVNQLHFEGRISRNSEMVNQGDAFRRDALDFQVVEDLKGMQL